MTELERELRALGAVVELPPVPELGPRVRARLAEPPRRRLRRPLVLALALVVLALGAAFAVPQSRGAILRFLGIEGVTVIRSEKLPPLATGPVATGRRVSLREGGRLLGFRPLAPDLGAPARVYADPQRGLLVLVYGAPRVRLRLTELRAGGLIMKFATIDQPIVHLRVNGGPGLWIPGPHGVDLFGQPRLAGSTLLWEQDGLTLRLEGHVTRREAVRIAASVKSS